MSNYWFDRMYGFTFILCNSYASWWYLRNCDKAFFSNGKLKKIQHGKHINNVNVNKES